MIYIAKEIQASTADRTGSPTSTTFAQSNKVCKIQGSYDWWYRTFLKYDLSGIPTNAIITSAKMRVYDCYHNDNGGSGTTNIARVTTEWDENSVSWNSQPSWEGTYLSEDVYPPGVGKWSDWDITELVRKWVDGTYPNYGVYIKNNNEGAYRYDWSIQNHFFSDSTLASYLEIEYVIPKRYIKGNTVGMSNPRPNYNQTDSTKADFILNKPLPIPTEADSGKFVRVDNGAYVLYDIQLAEEVSF